MDRDEAEAALERLWQEVDDASNTELEDERRARLQSVTAEIEALSEAGTRRARVLYLLGYTLYVHPDRSSSVDIQARLERALEGVLELVPDDALSQMYLGHHAYDMARYRHAQSWFAAVDLDQLQPYLQLKVLEMRVCCCLRTTSTPCSEQMARFAARCARAEAIEVHPLNLLRVLDDLARERGVDWLLPLVPDLRSLDAGGFNWFGSLLVDHEPVPSTGDSTPMLNDLDLDDFWADSEYARNRYVEGPVTDELIASVEAELGFELPLSYIALMRSQNGGMPKRTCFPTKTSTSWAEDHVAIAGILGIGRTKTYSLLGELGSQFMQEEWGYPTFGICVCHCPSGGHDMIMLDYRECGPKGEPAVVHVDQELDFKVTFLAADFETFVRGLVHESEYDESEAELAGALDRIAKGAFSAALAEVIRSAPNPPETEQVVRGLLGTVATEKGYFALHGDPLSHLVYDLLFELYSHARPVPSCEAFLEAYKELIAFGDGDVTTGGYAPGFIADWMKARLAAGEIVERDGTLALSDRHRHLVSDQLGRFGRRR